MRERTAGRTSYAPTSTPPTPEEGTPQTGSRSPALGRSRGGLTSQIPLACDGAGRPLDFTVTGGDTNDRTQFTAVVEAIRVRHTDPGRPRVQPSHVLGDNGYSSNAIRSRLGRRGIAHTIPERGDQVRNRLRRGSRGETSTALRSSGSRCLKENLAATWTLYSALEEGAERRRPRPGSAGRPSMDKPVAVAARVSGARRGTQDRWDGSEEERTMGTLNGRRGARPPLGRLVHRRQRPHGGRLGTLLLSGLAAGLFSQFEVSFQDGQALACLVDRLRCGRDRGPRSTHGCRRPCSPCRSRSAACRFSRAGRSGCCRNVPCGVRVRRPTTVEPVGLVPRRSGH
ncbi:transposase [Streptomyces sp. NK08204]|uniref:transposase n=1 Tax=Streptomyces sp. NK08204 TaxID=2873260 RepID=UPI0035A85077